jgi:hypothetical protein
LIARVFHPLSPRIFGLETAYAKAFEQTLPIEAMLIA